jgi:hypothetical protein
MKEDYQAVMDRLGLGLVVTGSVLFFAQVDFRNILKSAYQQFHDPKWTQKTVQETFAPDSEQFVMIHEGREAGSQEVR